MEGKFPTLREIKNFPTYVCIYNEGGERLALRETEKSPAIYTYHR